eukprot:TRINITY_DN3947_c0_g1_i2.p1 TRINITY_DN3947_c0_g1~~TRINITY_DN3947_c0_g1_i2.p1  ORF type:complete len:144 (-),score=22.33 TRINITY_DN3947_c0_g1_i2:328-759(-)
MGKTQSTDCKKLVEKRKTWVPKDIKPDFFRNVTRLTSIEATGIGLNEIPPEVLRDAMANLLLRNNLLHLDLSKNHVTSFPLEMCNFVNLKFLGLSKNSLNEIPEEMLQMVQLEELYLDYNNIRFVCIMLEGPPMAGCPFNSKF